MTIFQALGLLKRWYMVRDSMSKSKLSPTVKKEFQNWRNSLTPSVEITTTKTATNLHVHLSEYPEVALVLHFLKEEKKYRKSLTVAKALAEYFERHLELSPEEFEKLLKPAPTLRQLENMVKDYCKIVKRDVNKEILAVVYYDWEKERDIVHRVKVFLENSLEYGFTDLVKWELEEIRKLQVKIHYGLFGEILDLYSDFSREWSTRAYHDKKFRRKLDNLTKIVFKAERIATEIQISVESYLKSRKT